MKNIITLFITFICFLPVTSYSAISWQKNTKYKQFLSCALDKSGVLWAATVSSIVSYDGKDFVNYDYSVTNVRIPKNVVVDKYNRKWFTANSSYIVMYDDNEWKKVTPDSKHAQTINRVTVDNNGTLWACGVDIYSLSDSVWTRRAINIGTITRLATCAATDMNGNLWVGFTNGFSYYDGLKWTDYNDDKYLAGKNITSIGVDKNNVKWICQGGNGGGILCIDGDNWKRYDPDVINQYGSISYSSVNSLYIDDRNFKWFSTDKGIILFDGEKWYSIDGIQNENLNEIAMMPDESAIYCASPNYLIKGTGSILKLNNPAEYFNAKINSGKEISWLSFNIPEINIEYSIDKGRTWNFIKTADAKVGQYLWTP